MRDVLITMVERAWKTKEAVVELTATKVIFHFKGALSAHHEKIAQSPYAIPLSMLEGVEMVVAPGWNKRNYLRFDEKGLVPPEPLNQTKDVHCILYDKVDEGERIAAILTDAARQFAQASVLEGYRPSGQQDVLPGSAMDPKAIKREDRIRRRAENALQRTLTSNSWIVGCTYEGGHPERSASRKTQIRLSEDAFHFLDISVPWTSIVSVDVSGNEASTLVGNTHTVERKVWRANEHSDAKTKTQIHARCTIVVKTGAFRLTFNATDASPSTMQARFDSRLAEAGVQAPSEQEAANRSQEAADRSMGSIADRLRTLQRLLEQGLLSQAEFDRRREAILQEI
jgi:hypothetical protein